MSLERACEYGMWQCGNVQVMLPLLTLDTLPRNQIPLSVWRLYLIFILIITSCRHNNAVYTLIHIVWHCTSALYLL